MAKASKRDTLATQAAAVVNFLAVEYADAKCALNFQTPFQLLIATILSAQCTDERVNIVTQSLFKKCPSASEMAAIPQADLERLIQSAGFFRAKAKNILACSKTLVEKYGGKVPRTLEQLVGLPGVGRKTANVVLGTAFGIASGVVVDTHVTRLSNRLGLTKNSDAVKIEQDLMAILPSKDWIDFSHRLIHHGRRICRARKPDCGACGLFSNCPKIGVPAAILKEVQAPKKSNPVLRRAKAVKP